MITKLLAENVTNNWDVIKEAIRGSLPPFAIDTPDKMSRILESIILGHLEVWVYYDQTEEGVHIKSIWTTSLITDPESQTKNLLIYSIFNFDHGTPQNWLEGITAMREYAKANDCAAITGFTKEPHILRFVESLQGTTDVRFIKIPL